ncbi:MAG: GDSL-type esterase/lipase family protein [Rhodopseudomonas sp.]|uniref:SGNH/GDSL hydrolase family protein n=1 Tax=unclassified Rhodopseudomonas TaxID=2638247 RepID=UPI0013E03AA5|nr:GDSL-type esterase/lipase family protein [Rhodopseudomonas sp. BR0M22]NEW93862.1 SGNH/GDSL hydrolase family protein [Rhodopseudomonas sp. BR0M22]
MKAVAKAGLGWIAAAALLTAVGLSSPAVADPDAPACVPPAYLLATEAKLKGVAAALKTTRKLDILVVGSRSSTIQSAENSSYPGRLQALLRERFPGVTVNVTMEMRPKRTAGDIATGLGALVAERKPTLVIWQTGTYDAIRSIDPDEFRTALGQGIDAVKQDGADIILMNLQYSPRTETMINPAPYLDAMRVVAQEHDVPLFDRFALMRHWNETGEFDLFSPAPGIDLALRVHNCLARALMALVIEAAQTDPAEVRTQR